jgi:hypothetical protein
LLLPGDEKFKKKRCTSAPRSGNLSLMQGSRVLILTGEFKGDEGVCLGEDSNSRWAVSPDRSDEILSLMADNEFALLVDLSADPTRN